MSLSLVRGALRIAGVVVLATVAISQLLAGCMTVPGGLGRSALNKAGQAPAGRAVVAGKRRPPDG